MRKGVLIHLAIATSIVCTGGLYAQTASIRGQILPAQKKAIAGISVSLLNPVDSSTQKTSMTDESGNFIFTQVKDGNWRVMADAVGYKKYFSTVINIAQKDITLPTIFLQEAAAKELASVTVVASKPFTEQKIDRTVVNVDALISNTGSNALEVLEKTPGVMVDENGGITLKGKTGVLILIDDKPTYLSAADLATYLRSLPSSALDKIELMDNPPAKYDAAGNGGVINIKTKKSKLKGFNGSVSASLGQSVYARTNESANFNYYTGKVNLFVNAGYSIQKGFRDLQIDRTYFDAAGHLSSDFKQTNYFTPVTRSPNIKIGFDHYVSPKTTWGLVYTGSLSNRNEYRPTFSNVYNASALLDSSIVANNTSTSFFKKNGVNLNYTHKYDSSEKVLSFDMDYIHYSSGADQSFLNSTYSAGGGLKSSQQITARLPSNISIYAAKVDYARTFPGKVKIETGLKSSYVNSDNEANYFNVVSGVSSIDYNNTNHFIYTENINAAYLNYNKEFSRFSVQAGLRAENTNGNGHQLGNVFKPDSTFTKHYTSLFPTAFVSYKLDSAGNDLLNLSYGRRIDRPNYQDLNPFVFILDKFTAFSGNPFLRPQFSNDFKLAYTHKNKFTISAQYIHTSDVQIETIEQNGSVFISRNGNIGKWDYLVISFNATLHPAKWWTVNTYSDLFNYQVYSGQLYSGYIQTKSPYIFVQVNNQFTLGKGWSAETGGFYCSPRQQAQFDKIAFGQLNMGLQKKLLNNKATVKLAARDIFNTNTSTGFITNIPNVTAHYANKFHNQTFIVSFTYIFGKQSGNTEKRKVGSADTEAGRVGN
jgi:hypothetical protein